MTILIDNIIITVLLLSAVIVAINSCVYVHMWMFVAQLLSVVNLRSNQRSKYNTIAPRPAIANYGN